jgi:hypothetical protein
VQHLAQDEKALASLVPSACVVCQRPALASHQERDMSESIDDKIAMNETKIVDDQLGAGHRPLRIARKRQGCAGLKRKLTGC